MIAPAKFARNTSRVKIQSVAAPTGGWNARDALGDMKPEDAVILQNFWPGTTSVMLRNGYSQFATNITGQIETLMTYNSASASTMFAAATTKVYDVTSGGSIGAASKSGLTNARWQYINFTVTGTASYLLAVNGADKLLGWTGAAWYVDGDGSHDITGVDTAACSNITLFKNRIWLIQNASLKVWYLPINAISGAVTGLDMASLCKEGGYIMAAETWTIDAGYGVDDMLAFITSKGEVLVWRLTDPTSPSGIALVGVWRIGAPIGRRCFMKYAGDLLIITQDGVVPMSGALQSSRMNPRVSITDQIQFAMSAAISSYGSHFGWQLIQFPKENQLYLNVPINEGSAQQQYVQNNITRAWCNFTGWAANCWAMLNDDIYFGSNGYVGKAWSGTTDNNADIPGFALQSFQAWGGPAQKQVKMIRYHLLSDGVPSIYGNVNIDYDLSDSSAQLSAASGVNTSVWDTAVWNTGTWGSGYVPSADWQGATGIGYSFAPLLKTNTNGIQLQWLSTDLMLEPAGAF